MPTWGGQGGHLRPHLSALNSPHRGVRGGHLRPHLSALNSPHRGVRGALLYRNLFRYHLSVPLHSTEVESRCEVVWRPFQICSA